VPKKRKEQDVEELFKRAAGQYQDDCNQLFDETVYRLHRQTQMDEDEIRDWLGSLV
jgi:hypothetical protein